MSEDLLRRAEAGDSKAQSELGHRYYQGPIYPSPPKGGWSQNSQVSFFSDIPQDYKKSVYWCRRSANQGNPSGMFWLIRALRTGVEGDPPDYVEIYKWALLASAYGFVAANEHVEIIESGGYYKEPRITRSQLLEGRNLAVYFRPIEE